MVKTKFGNNPFMLCQHDFCSCLYYELLDTSQYQHTPMLGRCFGRHTSIRLAMVDYVTRCVYKWIGRQAGMLNNSASCRFHVQPKLRLCTNTRETEQLIVTLIHRDRKPILPRHYRPHIDCGARHTYCVAPYPRPARKSSC